MSDTQKVKRAAEAGAVGTIVTAASGGNLVLGATAASIAHHADTAARERDLKKGPQPFYHVDPEVVGAAFAGPAKDLFKGAKTIAGAAKEQLAGRRK